MSQCDNQRLILEVKQGESRSFSFTLYEGENLFNLNNYTIDFQVRKSPYLNVEPFINKHIDLDNTNPDGYITDANQGQFLVYINQNDFGNLPPKDYYVSIYLNNGPTRFSISGTGNDSSVIRFCKC